MHILILYRRSCEKMRKTIEDHLYSFKRYTEEAEFYYCDIIFRLPNFLKLVKWDAIILHYSVVSERFDQVLWKILSRHLTNVRKLKGYKIAIPQDEYAHTHELWKLFRKIGIETVFTCAQPFDYDKLYPLEETGLKHRISTLTGFVDEETFQSLDRLSQEIQERSIDIGYRARNLPFWLGRHARIKSDIAEKAMRASNPNDLKLDISTECNDVFYGDDWLRFLLRCRTALGCLGGASLYDPYGEIRHKVDKYTKNYPNATFDETERACFSGKDYSLSLFALSPRHFECAMTKTCQILVEGDYQGIFRPGIHYIELKKDYSNFAEVFEKAANKKLCEEIAEAAYQDIAISGKYTYKAFVQSIVNHIRKQITAVPYKQNIRLAFMRFLLKLHTRWWVPRMYAFKIWLRWEIVIKPKINSLKNQH